MRMGRTIAAVSSLALLGACGGGGGGGGSLAGGGQSGGAAPAPAPGTGACSLRSRQDWAAAQLREWYLFPETLPATLDPTPFASVNTYIEALTATARSQNRDRFFTYVTSIAEENAFFSSGSSAGFGVRLSYEAAPGRVFVTESFEGAPALDAGIDRGTEIVAIGTTTANLRTVSAIIAAEGRAGVTNALGPSDPGVTRILRITDAGGTRDVSVAKRDYALIPVSSRYGAKVIDDGGRRVGYLNLRAFISTADPQLRSAFADFRAQGITDVIVDFRYNGGGLVSTAELMGDLLGRNRFTSDVLSYTTFRAEKASENETRFFRPATQSIAPTRIAFIGTQSTASASELVINTFLPYLGSSVGLIGSNTFGKPVGQIAIDRSACDDRLRVVAFATQNADREGAYYNGLATTMDASCRAGDDLSRQLGDPQEASTRQALDFLAGRECTPISSATQSARSVQVGTPSRTLLTPDRPTAPQREVPGLF